jgi:hypothetical protein
MAELNDEEHKAVRVALDALQRVLTHVPEEPERFINEARV